MSLETDILKAQLDNLSSRNYTPSPSPPSTTQTLVSPSFQSPAIEKTEAQIEAEAFAEWQKTQDGQNWAKEGKDRFAAFRKEASITPPSTYDLQKQINTMTGDLSEIKQMLKSLTT